MRMLLEEAALIFYSVCARRGRNHTPEPLEALRQELSLSSGNAPAENQSCSRLRGIPDDALASDGGTSIPQADISGVRVFQFQ